MAAVVLVMVSPSGVKGMVLGKMVAMVWGTVPSWVILTANIRVAGCWAIGVAAMFQPTEGDGEPREEGKLIGFH